MVPKVAWQFFWLFSELCPNVFGISQEGLVKGLLLVVGFQMARLCCLRCDTSTITVPVVIREKEGMYLTKWSLHT